MKHPIRFPVILLFTFTLIVMFSQLHPMEAVGADFAVRENSVSSYSPPLASEFSSSVLSSETKDISSVASVKGGLSEPGQEKEKPVSPKDFKSISSAEEWNEWAALVNSGRLPTEGYTYELSRDLDFSSKNHALLPVGTLKYPFSGRFDGKGFRLTGINGVQQDGSLVAAPFGYTSGASIMSLGVETSGKGLHSTQYAAGIVGVALRQTSISSCFFSGITSGKMTGGLVAEIRGRLRITDCYAVVSNLRSKEQAMPWHSSGILIGLNVSLENDIRVENTYGLSPDRSVEVLFGPRDSKKGITTNNVYRFDIYDSDLLTQINADNLEGFDFERVWQQRDDRSLPLLKWQDFQAPLHLDYKYQYGSHAPVAISDPSRIIRINTGQQEVLIAAASHRKDMLVYSNIPFREDQGDYVLEMPTTQVTYTVNFISIESGQASISQLRFSRIDDNTVSGKVHGLERGEYYTVSFQSITDQGILSETFLYDQWPDETFYMSGIPEGTYDVSVKAVGYHPVVKNSLQINNTTDNVVDAELHKAIQAVKLTGQAEKRVDLHSRNRFTLVVTPEDAVVSYRDTEVWLGEEIAGEQDYHLSWSGDSFVFTPQISGTFVIRINLYDLNGTKYTDEVTVNAYREIQNIILPQTVDITSMDNPLEIIPRILPADATDTRLEWTLTSGKAYISLSPEGNLCRVYPKKVGVSKIVAKSVNGIERTVRIRVVDKTPPSFGEATFENITAVEQVMVSFPVEDDCEIARVTAVSKSGKPVSVSRLASEENGYAFEGTMGIEYIITATDINGNSETMSVMTAELLQAGTGGTTNSTNSGLAVSKSENSVSLWISANESEGAEYQWQKREKGGQWTSLFAGTSKLEDNDLTPNTWYEYRVKIRDETGSTVTKTSAVRTNPTPIQPEDINIYAGKSYGSIYVGESFPVVAVLSDQADVTGRSFSWRYDQDAMEPETSGSSIFLAKRAGTYRLEYVQTDTFDRTVRGVKMVEILSLNTPEAVTDRRFMMILWPMAASILALGLVAFVQAKRERAKLK